MMAQAQIIAEPGIPQIVITREFDAPRDLLFRAHTDPELLVRWLGPRRLSMVIDHFEVRAGDLLVGRGKGHTAIPPHAGTRVGCVFGSAKAAPGTFSD